MKKFKLLFRKHLCIYVMIIVSLIGNSLQAQVINENIPGTFESLFESQSQRLRKSNSLTNNNNIAANTNAVGLQQFFSSTGRYTLSADGKGSNSSSMTIRVNKPNALATVHKAILISSVTGSTITNGCVSISGVPVNWDGTASSTFFSNYWADVTSIVAAQINAFPTGISTLNITECNSGAIDGEALLVIFNDAAATEKTIIVMCGAMNPQGDNFSVTLAQPIDPAQPGALLDMGLGIGFGYQSTFGGGQTSHVSVNNQRLTSAAGGEDDGAPSNGALITVGGIGDMNTNPANPFAAPTNLRSDDELYSILPFITNTTTSLTINTINPSLDDNIFLAYFALSGAAVIGEGILLSQTNSSGDVGTDHTVKAAVLNSLGQPVPNRPVTFTVTSGPNAGNTFTTNTNSNGEAVYTYTGNGGSGFDNIQACFTNSQNQVDCSNTLSFEWLAPTQTISTNLLSNSIYCPGASFEISYTATGSFNSGNIFSAELSDATGSFTAPIIIGSLSASTSGTINATIPSVIAYGTGYRIRVVSSDPAIIGTDNGSNLTIGDNQNPAFTCPSNQDVNLNSSCQLVVPNLISALTGSDNCGTVTFSQLPVAGTLLGSSHNQTHNIVITASDGNGNTSQCTVVVTGKDITPPTINCVDNITKNNDAGICGAIVNYASPVSSDNCGCVAPASISGYTFLGTYNGHKYFRSTAFATWTNAKAIANGLSGHLATINSSAEQLFLQGATTDLAWIGFTDEANEGTFVWVTGEPVTYTNWLLPYEPNNFGGNENYAVFNGHGTYWNDLAGSNSLQYIVEFECETNTGAVIVTQTGGLQSGSTFPVGTTTNTFLATDGAGNTSTCSFTVTVNDVESPSITCPADKLNVPFDFEQLYATIAIGTAAATDNCADASNITIAGTRSDNVAITNQQYPLGTTTVSWSATDPSTNSSGCTQTITVRKRNTSLIYTGEMTDNKICVQYSDIINLQAKLTDNEGLATPNNISGRTITFQLLSETTVLRSKTATTNAIGVAMDTFKIEQAPGNYFVKTIFAGDAYFNGSNDQENCEVKQEDAIVEYNGSQYFTTASSTTLTGSITIAASLNDIDDGNDKRGDIRKAKATFRDGGPAGNVIGSANLPVGLVNPGVLTNGLSGTTQNNITLNSNEASSGGKIFQVWVGASDHYIGADAGPTPVTLALPGQDFVTGGGNLVVTNSAGTYAGTLNSKMNFGFTMKWNKSGKNLQGNINIVFRKWQLYNGVWQWRVYQAKSNAINSMAVVEVGSNGQPVSGTNPAAFRKAIINTKANLKDVTDPLNNIDLGGNHNLTLDAWDHITANGGVSDKISVTLMGATTNELLFSSSWSSNATQAQTITGGNINVRNGSGSGVTTKSEVTKNAQMESSVVEVKNEFSVKAYPNPSQRQFTLIINSGLNEPVQIQLYDVVGRKIQTLSARANESITFGEKLKAGIYIAKVIQDKKQETVKLIKQ